MAKAARNLTTHIIAVGNQKGGVAKTSNCVHLARALAELGRKCLIVDLDMNHGSTNHFAIDPDAWGGSYEMLLGSEEPEDMILSNDTEEEIWLPENIDLIPARRALENLDFALREKNKMVEPHRVLVAPLDKLRGLYDYIFLDTGPNATTPTIAAYKACDWFVLSAMPETFAVQGLSDALSDIKAARQHGNSKLRILGLILSRVDKRTRLARELLNYIDQTFTGPDGKNRTFGTTISESTIVPAAQKLGKTIFETEPTHKVTEQYRKLAQEVEARLREYAKVTGDAAARLDLESAPAPEKLGTGKLEERIANA